MVYEKLINKIKPYRLSKILGIPSSTIYSWRKSGIPSWRVEQIKAAALKFGIDLSDCEAVPNG